MKSNTTESTGELRIFAYNQLCDKLGGKLMKKGISLITLVITIVVIIILAAAVILTLGNNNPIESARKASFLQNFSNLNDEYALFCSSMMLKDYDFVKENLGIEDGKIMYNGEELDGGETLHDILPSLKGSSLDGKITIKAGELALDSNLLNETEKDTAADSRNGFHLLNNYPC